MYEHIPKDMNELICYANRAMLGEIRPKIRKISIDFIKETMTITLYFYFDSELTEDELNYDFVGVITTELIADFPSNELTWDEKTFVIPYPQLIKEKGTCIYSRYEEI